MLILVIVLTSILATIFIGSAGFFLFNSHKKRVAIWTDAANTAKRLNDVMETNTEAIKTNMESLATVPKLIEGMTKIAAEQVVQINMLRSEVEKFRKLVFKKDSIPGVDVPSEEQKGYWYEAEQLRASNPGMSREEAFQKVIDGLVSSGVDRDFEL